MGPVRTSSGPCNIDTLTYWNVPLPIARTEGEIISADAYTYRKIGGPTLEGRIISTKYDGELKQYTSWKDAPFNGPAEVALGEILGRPRQLIEAQFRTIPTADQSAVVGLVRAVRHKSW